MGAVVGLDLERQAAERIRHARADVVTERDRPNHVHAGNAEHLTRGEGGRHDRAAWMRMRGRVGVVGLIGMREHAVDHRRFHRAAQHVRRCHGRHFLAAARARERQRDLAGRKRGAGHHRGEGVEDVVLRFLEGFAGECARGRASHVAGQLFDDGRRALRGAHARASRHDGGRDHAASRLQQRAPGQMVPSSIPVLCGDVCVFVVRWFIDPRRLPVVCARRRRPS